MALSEGVWGGGGGGGWGGWGGGGIGVGGFRLRGAGGGGGGFVGGARSLHLYGFFTLTKKEFFKGVLLLGILKLSLAGPGGDAKKSLHARGLVKET